MGKFIGENFFSCWDILRVYGPHFWSSCPIIEFATLPYGHGELKGIEQLSYQTKGSAFQHCEHFLFHFFM